MKKNQDPMQEKNKDKETKNQTSNLNAQNSLNNSNKGTSGIKSKNDNNERFEDRVINTIKEGFKEIVNSINAGFDKLGEKIDNGFEKIGKILDDRSNRGTGFNLENDKNSSIKSQSKKN